MNTFNTIYLKRRNKVVLSSGGDRLNLDILATILKNIESLGYTFSPALIECVASLPEAEASLFYSQLVRDLQRAIGSETKQKVRYEPMYPNFPQQVMELPEAELYINAIVHYTGTALGVRLLPQYAKKERPPLAEEFKLKIIDLGTEAELLEIFRNLLGANTSLSPQDKSDIIDLVSRPELAEQLLPETIGYKENLAFISALLLRYHPSPLELVAPYFKTATDVLRLVTAMSDGDVSLAENTIFRKLKRPERRFILGLLEQCNSIAEDMLRDRERWLRVGEITHPFEYKKRFPQVAEAFDIIRNNKPFTTFNSLLERAFIESRWQDSIELLQTRPGEFARKLDFLLRNNQDKTKVIEAFQKVCNRVATPVLLQVIAHFEHRSEAPELRVFFPKGNVAKAYAIKNELPEIEVSICNEIVSICQEALKQRFAKLPSLGKVYVAPELKNFPVPFSQRSASKALQQLSRGSRLPIPTKDTMRFFIWWKEGIVNGIHIDDVDIDLSAVMYDADWNYLEHVSYTNLRSSKYQAVHSGDITSAPEGASEFIDLNLPSILEYGGRYIVVSVLSFNGQPFCNLPECFAGWMNREDADKGHIYEPRTVEQKVDLTANTTVSIPAILDLEERKVIWADMSLSREPSWGRANNVEDNAKGMVLIGKAMTNFNKPTLDKLFELHALARGEIVDSPETADTIFAVDTGITPYNIDTIAAQFLV